MTTTGPARSAGSSSSASGGSRNDSSGSASSASGRAAGRQPSPTASYRLVRTAPAAAARLQPDEAQDRVLAHAARGNGPLLVLAGPGTGKTTTLVEAVARTVERGVPPEQVLVLTFSRKAAEELRARTTARLGTVTSATAAWTFHAFCYALLREHQSTESFTEPLRLLGGPEQDVALRELLMGSLQLGHTWPTPLRAALGTRGLAEQVRGLWSRARELGMEPDDLGRLALREGRADWAALASFFHEYLDVLDAQGAVDHSELVHRAVLLAEDPDIQAQLRKRFTAVFVDEYQDTDPAQERLLQALAGQGRDLVVVGDPDQAIYAFRGAEVSGLLDFPHRFPRADGSPAPVLALQTCRRSGRHLLEVSRRVATRLPTPGLPTDKVRAHRDLQAGTGLTAGVVEAHTYPSPGAEAEAIADLLRREHLERGTPWSRMAVLVRSGARSVPLLRRVLTAAGVPLEIAGDELPLAQEPAVAPLLLALRVADAQAQVERAGSAHTRALALRRLDRELTVESARELLLSPLGGADPSALRRLGRALRAQVRTAAETAALPQPAVPADPGPADLVLAEGELAAGAAGPPAAAESVPAGLPASSAQLLREALVDPRSLLALDARVARPAARLAVLLARAREVLIAGDGPEQALWELWDGSPWSARLEQASLAGGPAGRAADRDLDAVMSLFATVSRTMEKQPVAGAGPLLDLLAAQQIPGDVLADRGTRTEAVRLLTAHRSKGLEWDVVVVAAVQDGVWPDLRRRSTLLDSDQLAAPAEGGLRDGMDRASLLVDERRLFYVALTRARRRLVVTAVDSGEEDGERPSRFLDELGVEVQARHDRIGRPLSLPALVAALRRETVDPTRSPELRRAAAARLAALATARDGLGRLLVPAAHPDRWWGLADATHSDRPIQPAGQPIRLSGTTLAGLTDCPLKWFLEHEAKAQQATTSAMGFGSVLHAVAHEVAKGTTPPDLDALMSRLDTVWAQLAYDAPWQSEQQHADARAALARFLLWHTDARGRELVATEVPFEVEVPVGENTVLLRGFIDRVELDADGRVHIVDLKTAKQPATASEIKEHAQLGTYQHAVRFGALEEHLPGPPEVGGAELVLLRVEDKLRPKVQGQSALPASPSWFDELLETAVEHVVAEQFPATPTDSCERCQFRRACPAQSEGRQVVE